MAFVIVTAVITELLSSVLFVAANVFGKHVRPTFEQIRQVRLAELEKKYRPTAAGERLPKNLTVGAQDSAANGMASTEKNLDPVTQNNKTVASDIPDIAVTNQPRYQKIDTNTVTNQTKDDSVQNHPRTSAPPVEPSNDVTTRTGGGKRKAVSYDTGTRGDKGTRYQAIKAKILSGELNPSTSQLRKHWQCNYETAAAYLLAMAEEGLLVRNPANSQYTLREGA